MTLTADQIEHTVLGPTTTESDVRECLEAADEWGMRACVPPAHIKFAANNFPDVSVTTVANFPNGTQWWRSTMDETSFASERGAAEVDVVAPTHLLKSGEFDTYQGYVNGAVRAAKTVKVIVETPLLTPSQLETACELCSKAGADYIKTATGWYGDTEVWQVREASGYLPVKASGGISTAEQARAMVDAGAERIGTSSGVDIVKEL